MTSGSQIRVTSLSIVFSQSEPSLYSYSLTFRTTGTWLYSPTIRNCTKNGHVYTTVHRIVGSAEYFWVLFCFALLYPCTNLAASQIFEVRRLFNSSAISRTWNVEYCRTYPILKVKVFYY